MGTATVNYTGVPDTGNVLIDSLVWGSKWESVGPTEITVGFFPSVESYSATGALTGSRDLSPAEVAAILAVLAEFEKYLNVNFIYIGEDDVEESDIQFVLSNDAGVDYLGEAAPPGEQGRDAVNNPGFSEVWVYTNNYANVGGALAPGGYDYITFIHEFGHAMGLAHPHDDGGTSNPNGSELDWSSIFPGVTSAFDDYGDFSLNQGIFTTMSYNDGWPEKGKHGDKLFGYQSGLMALDILALQTIYGANNTYATGNDSYVLPGQNGPGTYFSCIWDNGGSDSIVINSMRSCVIDLRAATGVFGAGGGGYVSYVTGIRGGYTIAVGAVIENATGGRSMDTLVGNEVGNILTGLGGKDRMTGNGGADEFIFTSVQDTSFARFRADVITDFEAGSDHINMAGFDADASVAGIQLLIWEFIEGQAFSAAGQVRSVIDVARNQTVISINTDADAAAEALIVLLGQVALTDSDFIFT